MLDQGADITAAKGTWALGSTTAVAFGLTAHELAAVSGVLIALIGVLYNVWAGERREAREAGENARREFREAERDRAIIERARRDAAGE